MRIRCAGMKKICFRLYESQKVARITNKWFIDNNHAYQTKENYFNSLFIVNKIKNRNESVKDLM